MAPSPAARPDAIRRHNLGLLLEQVHRDGELTRAQLTQRLGLNRSTIGALVADLTELGVLGEHVPSSVVSDRAGRPSHVVGPRPDGPYALAADVEVDRVTVAAVGIGGNVLARHTSPLRPGRTGPARVAGLPRDAVGLLVDGLPGAEPVGLGIAIPASLSRRDGMVLFAPNLRWSDEAFSARVAAQLVATAPDLPVLLGNDANLGALAEYRRGAARGADDAVYLLGRIGVGAGIIAGGAPLYGAEGLAGEAGHIVLDAAGLPCHCGNTGCVETFVSDTALLRAAGRTDVPGRASVAALFADARAGDRAACDAVLTVADSLGRSIATLVNLLNPALVVTGGSLAGVLRLAQPAVEAALQRSAVRAAGRALRLTVGTLEEDASLLGAAELAFEGLLADPLSFASAQSARRLG